MTAQLLVVGCTVAATALYVVAAVGVLCVFGEALCRGASWHRRRLAVVRRSR